MARFDPTSPVVLPVPATATVQVHADLAYAHLDERTLRLDLYAPVDQMPASGWPAVLLVHGTTEPTLLGGVRGWGQYTSWGRLLAARGLVAVVAEHRSFDEAPAPQLANEVDAALGYVRGHAVKFGIDVDRLAVFGISAGVPLAVGAIASAADRSVQCAVAYYGYLDTPADLAQDTGLARLSALAQLQMGTWLPPLLVVRAGSDRPELNRSIDAFIVEALARNLAVEVVNYPQGHHGFDVLDDTDQSRRIIRHTLGFLQERLHQAV